jgi:hypothetical protein
MRLLGWTPIVVGPAELARRQERYDRLCPDHVLVVLHDLGEVLPSAPVALETDEDVRASEDAVVAAYRQSDPQGFDAFLPDCVLDPAVDLQDLARPVLGLSRIVSAFLAGQGMRVGALARNPAIARELDRRLQSYLMDAQPTVVMDLTVEDIADDDTWRRAVAEHAADLQCDVALNACSAVDLGDPTTDTLVVDPTALALRLIGVRAELGRTGS